MIMRRTRSTVENKESQYFTLTTEYSLHYSTKEAVPIPDIIESLKATERLLKRTPVFLEKRFDSVKVTETQVYVDKLESGSLDLKFLVKFVCRTDERTDKAMALIKEISEEKGLVRDIVAVGVGSMLTIGAFQIFSPGAAAPSTTINAYHSTVIQAGQDVGLSEAQMKEAIESIPDQKSLGKDTFNVLKPATQDKDATLDIPGKIELSIDRDIIDDLPDQYEAPMPEEKTSSYVNIRLIVDASDRHNTERGWAGSAPGIIESRTKFVLDESIDPSALHGKTLLNATVRVVERYVPSKKKYEVKEILILDVHE